MVVRKLAVNMLCEYINKQQYIVDSLFLEQEIKQLANNILDTKIELDERNILQNGIDDAYNILGLKNTRNTN